MGADPYAGMSDDQVLKRASTALKKRIRLPIGSIEREIQRAVFDSAMTELDRRAITHILGKLTEDS